MTRRSDVTAALRRGRRRRTPRLDIVWCGNDKAHPRFATVVPRHGQTVVCRNQLRRRLQEIVRTRLLPELGALDLIVRARPAAYRSSFHQLVTELETWARTHTG